MKKPINILIVTKHQTYLLALRSVISHIPNCVVCGIEEDGFNLLSKQSVSSADVLLIDLGMSAVNGIDVSKLLLKKHNKLKIIGLALHFDAFRLEEILEIGIKGLLLKNTTKKEIETALLKVVNGGIYIPQAIIENLNTLHINN